MDPTFYPNYPPEQEPLYPPDWWVAQEQERMMSMALFATVILLTSGLILYSQRDIRHGPRH